MATYPQNQQYTDPFDYEKIPSLSWKGLPPGSTFVLEVLEAAKSLQTTNFESQEPAFWDKEKQRPKMAAVIHVRVASGPHSVGEERNIWATIPSNLFVAIREALKKADTKAAPGGVLSLRFTGEIPHEKPHMNAIKQYQAKYDPPATAADPFGATPPPTQPAQPALSTPTPAPKANW